MDAPLYASAFTIITFEEKKMEALLLIALIALAVCVVVLISKKVNKKAKPRTYLNNSSSYGVYKHSVNCECRDCLKNLSKHHW
jgi:hypothetical protein